MSRGGAFFAGSFDPFTLGHKEIAERGVALFGRVIIGVGYNPAKQGHTPVEERLEAIRRVFPDRDRVEVIAYTGLTAEAAREAGAACLLRGVRNAADYEYEKTLAEVNRKVFGLETVMLCADPSLGFISSSMVNELKSFGRDVDEFLP